MSEPAGGRDFGDLNRWPSRVESFAHQDDRNSLFVVVILSPT